MDFTKLKDVSIEDLLKLSPDELTELLMKLRSIDEYETYNRLSTFKPFDYQRKFMNAGANYQIRYLRAGNRLGKTYGAAAEFAYHLTGLYPDDWEGLRVNDGGHTYWCIGINLDSVSKVIQKELIGTADCRVKELVGSGAIPRKCIEEDKGWTPEGARLRQCMIRHKDGQLNTLMFYGSENIAGMYGQKCRGIWMDEEPPYDSIEVYSNAKTRLQNAGGEGVDGFLMITATPEAGQTPLNDLFDNDDSGYLYLQQVSLDDCPLYTPEQIEKIMSTLPAWQRDMRRHGLPVIGKGAVFSFDEDDITVSEVRPLPHWQVIAGVDWGHVVDPTTIVIAMYDPDNDTYYIYDEFYLDEDEESRSPRGVAKALLDSPYRAVPIVVPHDSGLESDASESNGKMLKRLGLNVLPDAFINPSETKLNVNFKSMDSGKKSRRIETGLQEMRFMFTEGKLKVLERCEKWLKEKRTYSYKHNNNTNKLGYAGADHVIDASRYAVMSLMANKGCNYIDVANMEATHFNSPKPFQFNL